MMTKKFVTLMRFVLHLHNHSSRVATDGIIKHSEAISKSAKVHRKPSQSFTTVIELLLESIITFVPPSEDKTVVGESSLVIDMEIDVASSKGKGKAIASGFEEKEDTGQESFDSFAKVVFILKLLKEILYCPYVHVLVRKDVEFSNSHGGGIFHHILVQQSPRNDIQAFVDLLDDVLDVRSRARTPIGSLISREASATFIDVGLLLELVTKEHVYFVEANATKTDNQVKPSCHLEHGGAEYTGGISESIDNASLPNASFAPAEVVKSFIIVQTYGGSEFVTYDMKHDQDIDRVMLLQVKMM
nr:hypothetical protein [Tanacetum cinerariifolium]